MRCTFSERKLSGERKGRIFNTDSEPFILKEHYVSDNCLCFDHFLLRLLLSSSACSTISGLVPPSVPAKNIANRGKMIELDLSQSPNAMDLLDYHLLEKAHQDGFILAPLQRQRIVTVKAKCNYAPNMTRFFTIGACNCK